MVAERIETIAAESASACRTPPEVPAAERRRTRLCRMLLYGSPLAAAALAVSMRLAAPHLPPTWPVGSVAVVANGLLSALGSAAGALWLPNPLALRVAHAASAAVVSLAVYLVLLAATNTPVG